MTEDPTVKLAENAEDAKKWLAAEYGYAQQMLAHEANVEQYLDAGKVDEGLRRTRLVLQDFKMVARAERKAERNETDVEHQLKHLEEQIPEDQRQKIHQFIQQIHVANAHLKRFASFYRGELRDEIQELQAAERDEKKWKALEDKFAGDEKYQHKFQAVAQKVKAELSKLKAATEKLRNWISTNTTLVKTIESWAKSMHA